MALALDEFATQLVASQLVSADELRAFVNALPQEKQPRDGGQLARELVRQKRLTPYQATQVYLGKLQNLTLGSYRILDRLGQGGMGLVLKAEHKLLKRLVAIKVLSPAITTNQSALQRFQREVETAAKLSHPNIVAAYDADQDHKTRFLVFEYVDGIDLFDYVQQHGPLPVQRALSYLHGAAKGLEYAHQQGVIHRDIKPSNLLLDHTDTIRVMDMGLARLEENPAQSNFKQASLTETGIIMGTVDFMAPEQAENMRKADARSDLYSLGICFYYLLTGQLPYVGETFLERILAHREWPIPSIRVLRQDVSEAVDDLFRKMVAKRPIDRYQSMTRLIAALARCMAGEVNHRNTNIPIAIPVDHVPHFVPPPLPWDHPSRRGETTEAAEFDWTPASRIMNSPIRRLSGTQSAGSVRHPLKDLKFVLSSLIAIVALCLVGWSLAGIPGPISDSRRAKPANQTSAKLTAKPASVAPPRKGPER